MKRLNVNVLSDYPAYFPVEKSLVYLIGENGSGKSHLLKALKHHFENEGEDVLYFSDSRFFGLSNQEFINFIMFHQKNPESYLTKYEIDYEHALKEVSPRMYISSGLHQILNFFGQIEQKKEVIVIIDEPERHLDLYKQRNLTRDIKNLPNVKKLIVATHSPSIIEDDRNFCLDISGCINLYGKLVYLNEYHLPEMLKIVNNEWKTYIKNEIINTDNRLKWLFVLSEEVNDFLIQLTIESLCLSENNQTFAEAIVTFGDNKFKVTQKELEIKSSTFLCSPEEQRYICNFFKEFPLEDLFQEAYSQSLLEF